MKSVKLYIYMMFIFDGVNDTLVKFLQPSFSADADGMGAISSSPVRSRRQWSACQCVLSMGSEVD